MRLMLVEENVSERRRRVLELVVSDNNFITARSSPWPFVEVLLRLVIRMRLTLLRRSAPLALPPRQPENPEVLLDEAVVGPERLGHVDGH